jgi:hypothetical protein
MLLYVEGQAGYTSPEQVCGNSTIEESENDEVLGSVNRSIGDWQLDSRVILEKDTCMDQSWKNMTYK